MSLNDAKISRTLLLLPVLLAASGSCAADWPTFRGDRMRSGAADLEELPQQLPLRWRFEDADYRMPAISSSPAVWGDRIYVGIAEHSVFRPSGRVICLEAATGRRLWEQETRCPVFSSPALGGGRVFIGEGYHHDTDCELRAFDALSGEKLWSFPTRSHVESSPHFWCGRVYFGAGDDGIYCLSAEDGGLIWHLPALHVDLSPLVAAGRLFAGSGYGDLVVLCADAESGAVRWRTPVDLPVWGSPVLLGNRIYFGLGNGNFVESHPQRPRGALICFSATSGKPVWRQDLPDAVLTAVAAAGGRLFAGCRDGQLYSFDAESGALRWKRPCGGPVVASPLLAAGGRQVAAASTSGRLLLFDASGETLLGLDLAGLAGGAAGEAQVLSSPAAHRGRILVGTATGALLSLGRE